MEMEMEMKMEMKMALEHGNTYETGDDNGQNQWKCKPYAHM